MTDFVSYVRVSRESQGRSGLGLEAQREAVGRHIAAARGDLIQEFLEVETGKGANALERRPVLRAAMELAGRRKAVFIIAKLDRLARSVAFISALMDSKAEFVAADMPHANRLTLHIMAAFAEHERDMIAERTRLALAASKARGTRLGTNSAALAVLHRAQAVARIEPLAESLRAMRAEGMSQRSMAIMLNDREVPSPGGGRWHKTNIKRALGRI